MGGALGTIKVLLFSLTPQRSNLLLDAGRRFCCRQLAELLVVLAPLIDHDAVVALAVCVCW